MNVDGNSRKESDRRAYRGTWMAPVFFAIIFSISGCMSSQVKQEQADHNINIASAYIQSGQFQPALKELLEAEKLVPENPKVHYLLGIAYHGRGLSQRAVDEFGKAVALKPDYSEAHNHLGRVYFEMGQLDKAIVSFQHALANVLYDTPSVALYNLGKVYQKKGDLETAMSKFREATTRDTNNSLIPLVEKDMAVILYERGDYEGAVVHLKKAIDRAPAFVEAYFWLGECYLKAKDRGRAADAFNNVVRFGPESDFAAKAKKHLEMIKGR